MERQTYTQIEKRLSLPTGGILQKKQKSTKRTREVAENKGHPSSGSPKSRVFSGSKTAFLGLFSLKSSGSLSHQAQRISPAFLPRSRRHRSIPLAERRALLRFAPGTPDPVTAL
jgi:hypothetical protein